MAILTTRVTQALGAPLWRCMLLCLGLPGPCTALAQDEERSWNLGVALGYGERGNPLINGEHIDINAVVDLSWYGERFFFDNGDFGFTLYEARNHSFNLITTYNNERNYYNYLTGRTFGLRTLLDNHFAAQGEGIAPTERNKATSMMPAGYDPETLNLDTELPDRDFAVNGGVEFLYISRWGDIQAQLLSDISSTHNGQEAWLSWSKPWYTQRNEFTLTLGLEWKSANLVSYYYGVRADEAFPGREFYDGDPGTNGFVRFAARHAFNTHWHLVGMLEREFLSSAIRRSPVVDKDQVDTFFAGLLYRF